MRAIRARNEDIEFPIIHPVLLSPTIPPTKVPTMKAPLMVIAQIAMFFPSSAGECAKASFIHAMLTDKGVKKPVTSRHRAKSNGVLQKPVAKKQTTSPNRITRNAFPLPNLSDSLPNAKDPMITP